MPVHDHIHSQLRSVGYAIFYQLFQLFFVSTGTIAAVFRRIHGEADTVSIPVVTQGTEGIIIDILGEPGNSVGRHAVKLNGVAVFVCQLTVFYMESTMLPVGRGGIHGECFGRWGFSFRRLGFDCFGDGCLFGSGCAFGDGLGDGSGRCLRGGRCGFIGCILFATAGQCTGTQSRQNGTAQCFLKIDIGTSFLNESNKNINNGLLFQNYNNTNTYRKYYSCPGYGWQEMIAPE